VQANAQYVRNLKVIPGAWEAFWNTDGLVQSETALHIGSLGRRCCMHLRATTPSCSEIAWIGLLPFGRSACARENERRAAAALGPGAVDSSQLTIYSALIAGGELLHFKF
jgi:hypothetical protein